VWRVTQLCSAGRAIDAVNYALNVGLYAMAVRLLADAGQAARVAQLLEQTPSDESPVYTALRQALLSNESTLRYAVPLILEDDYSGDAKSYLGSVLRAVVPAYHSVARDDGDEPTLCARALWAVAHRYDGRPLPEALDELEAKLASSLFRAMLLPLLLLALAAKYKPAFGTPELSTDDIPYAARQVRAVRSYASRSL
jgi:hypothetical protein